MSVLKRLSSMLVLAAAAACVPVGPQPGGVPQLAGMSQPRLGGNSCRWAHDNQCDHPGLGTGACAMGTDVDDCGSLTDWPRQGRYDREFFGHDDRVAITPDAQPWSAIGKLMFRHGYCTAALVSPRVLITAAHCMFTDDGSIDRPERFLAGFDQGDYIAQSAVVSFWVPSTYDFRRFSDTSEIDGLDYAFLLLADPIGLKTGYFGVHTLSSGELSDAVGQRWQAITQAGYSGDREGQLTAHIGCSVTTAYEDNTVAHECDTLQGASGSPFFIDEGGRFEIIAIESAVYDTKRPLNIAVDSRAFASDLGRYLAKNDPG